jgi:hypothetical protein
MGFLKIPRVFSKVKFQKSHDKLTCTQHSTGNIQRFQPLVTQIPIQHWNLNFVDCWLVCCAGFIGIHCGKFDLKISFLCKIIDSSLFLSSFLPHPITVQTVPASNSFISGGGRQTGNKCSWKATLVASYNLISKILEFLKLFI